MIMFLPLAHFAESHCGPPLEDGEAMGGEFATIRFSLKWWMIFPIIRGDGSSVFEKKFFRMVDTADDRNKNQFKNQGVNFKKLIYSHRILPEVISPSV